MSWLDGIRAFGRDERVILVTIGFATASVITSVVASLMMLRDEVILPPSQAKPRYITQDTEDALEGDTIEKLLEHPNYSVNEIALRILADRAINSEDTIKTLLYGTTRPDYDERLRCLRALALLMSFDPPSTLHHPHTYSALVRSLELSLEDAEIPSLEDYHWDEFPMRETAEKLCLMLISSLVDKNGPRMLLKAKFVEKWLAKQNWGSAGPERRRRFADYMGYKMNKVVEIVNVIRISRRGLKALERVGLLEESHARRQMQELPDVIMEMEPESILESIEQPDSQLPRAREQSVEEQRLRRQHREAMVLNDGTRPLGRGDIFERDHGSPD